MKKAKEVSVEVMIEEFVIDEFSVWLKGTTPIILNAMSEKAKRELLNPRGSKTRVDKLLPKHDPYVEYRNSIYKDTTADGPTRIIFPCPAFKRAMKTAANEISGMRIAQINRLIHVGGYMTPIYGVPKLYMAVVISGGISRAPDLRTRAVLPEWCCKINVKLFGEAFNQTNVSRLLGMAGKVCGVGDDRGEKGHGDFGCFDVSSESECAAIVAAGGREAQDKALEEIQYFDEESMKLCEWHYEENKRRGRVA